VSPRRAGPPSRRRYAPQEAFALPIAALQDGGVIARGPGPWWTCRWMRGAEVAASMGIRVAGAAPSGWELQVTYEVIQEGARPIPHDYLVHVEVGSGPSGQPGGWFRCPRIRGGRRCHRRCEVLYLPPGAETFGCRGCQRIAALSWWPPVEGALREVERALREVTQAERDLALASSLDTLGDKLAQLTAARRALAELLRPQLQQDCQTAELRAKIDRLLSSPHAAPLKTLVRCGAALAKAHRESGRALRVLLSRTALEIFLATPEA
jgi:hypothetical protein